MRIGGRRQSQNVEDRRGMAPARRRAGGIGCGGLVFILLISYLTGNNPLMLLQMMGGGGGGLDLGAPAPAGQGSTGPLNDQMGVFASQVLGSTEDNWNRIFQEMGRSYPEPRLVLFEGSVDSRCGVNSSAVGPFYCPADSTIYIDLGFFGELERRFGAPGDFAQAYVLAHEVGHHVQNVLGISDQVRQQQARSSQAQANQLSVGLELMADCLAGVWAARDHRNNNLLEPGDVEEGLRAAAAIGDDNIQRQMQGRVVPESFTHGTSQQRMQWLRRGMESGQVGACETFGR